ncbi:MAG: alkaline phosphatase family protein [Candidatus Bathyarchaeota archaeon]|nr:alkaline phosphatase family protein [Candidatus Bathyarchaeum sp.]
MMHELSDSIRNHDNGGFLYPCYEENCISNIPGTILDLFNVKTNLPKLPIEVDNGAEEINKVVLFVLDGFGYNQFSRYHEDNKFLTKLAEKSEVFPLTSIFPSQTTNALTTLNTGLTPQEHGLFEYYLYLKEVDRIVNTLRFEPLGSNLRNELLDSGFKPNILFDGKTIQSSLKEAGIKSFTHIYASYAYSHYSKLLFDDSTFIPSLKSSDLIVTLKKKLQKESGPAYFFVHLSNLDTISHEYGPNSYEYGAELSAISYLLNKELVQKIDPQTAKETLVLLTSDHGSVNIVPEQTTYLNGFSDIIKNLQKGNNGEPVLPTGSARDVFLHVQEQKLTQTQKLLEQKVGHKAKIVETKDALADGLFGHGKISRQFVDRAGNLLILPYRNETVWFDHFPSIRYNPVGQHGGLNEEEMLVPLAITNLNNLK